jgi:hypothetical protein
VAYLLCGTRLMRYAHGTIELVNDDARWARVVDRALVYQRTDGHVAVHGVADDLSVRMCVRTPSVDTNSTADRSSGADGSTAPRHHLHMRPRHRYRMHVGCRPDRPGPCAVYAVGLVHGRAHGNSPARHASVSVGHRAGRARGCALHGLFVAAVGGVVLTYDDDIRRWKGYRPCPCSCHPTGTARG